MTEKLISQQLGKIKKKILGAKIKKIKQLKGAKINEEDFRGVNLVFFVFMKIK